MIDKKRMEQFILQCPGFVSSSHPTPTSARYVFCDATVCISLYEAYNYAHVMNGQLRLATDQEKVRWNRGEPVPGGVRTRNDELYIDTKAAADMAFTWDEISGRHD